MKLPAFEYAALRSLEEALSLLASGDGMARVIAGGQKPDADAGSNILHAPTQSRHACLGDPIVSEGDVGLAMKPS
jgi:hypothetical protein